MFLKYTWELHTKQYPLISFLIFFFNFFFLPSSPEYKHILDSFASSRNTSVSFSITGVKLKYRTAKLIQIFQMLNFRL